MEEKAKEIRNDIKIRIEHCFDSKNQEQVERVFKINLKGRHWYIKLNAEETELTFFEDENCFGWTERINTADFFKRLYELNFLLKL